MAAVLGGLFRWVCPPSPRHASEEWGATRPPSPPLGYIFVAGQSANHFVVYAEDVETPRLETNDTNTCLTWRPQEPFERSLLRRTQFYPILRRPSRDKLSGSKRKRCLRGIPLHGSGRVDANCIINRQADRRIVQNHFFRRFQDCTSQIRSHLEVDFLHDANTSIDMEVKWPEMTVMGHGGIGLLQARFFFLSSSVIMTLKEPRERPLSTLPY